jgi:hypothetical protein
MLHHTPTRSIHIGPTPTVSAPLCRHPMLSTVRVSRGNGCLEWGEKRGRWTNAWDCASYTSEILCVDGESGVEGSFSGAYKLESEV